MELYWLHGYAEKEDAPLRLIPVIHWIWANCHSLFVLGLVTQAAFMTGIAFRDRRFDRRLFRVFAASVVASFLTPYGWRGFVFPFTLLSRFQSGNPFAQSIGEFVSPFSLHLSDQYPFWPQVPIGAFRVLGLAAVLTAPGLVKTRRFPSLLLAAVFGALGARMIRNMPLFVIATLPGTAWGLSTFAVRRGKKRGRKGERAPAPAPFVPAPLARFGGPVAGALVTLVTATLILRVLTDAYYLESRRAERFGWGWNENVQPIGAARYADRVALHSPMLNHLNFGGFLMWARPDPVFIDGRLEVVGETFYRQYNEVLASADAREACVARYGIGWIVFPYATNPRLLGELSEDLRWRLAYRDHLAAIFVRSGPGSDAFVDSRLSDDEGSLAVTDEIAALPGLGPQQRPGKAARFMGGLIHRQRFPTEAFNRGLFHYYRGELDRAERDFEEAIIASEGRYYELYNNLGAALYRQKRGAEAAACYRVVLEEDPTNRLALERMSTLRGRGGLR